MTPQSTLDAMFDKYAGVATYQDSGIVITKWPNWRKPSEKTFETYFCRPDRFLFKWASHHPCFPLPHSKTRHAIWSDGHNAFSFVDSDGLREDESLSMAIAGATGISMGAALTVSNMLLPKIIAADSFADLTDLRVREDIFESSICHCIQGRNHNGEAVTIYLGMEDLFLRSVSISYESGVISQEIRRDIIADQQIDPQIFKHRPDK